MRKGRFTQIEIQKAIANDFLGVKAFFCLLLKVLINGSLLKEKSGETTNYKYFSYYFAHFDSYMGLIHEKKFQKKKLKKISKMIEENFSYFKKNQVAITCFLNYTFTYISAISVTLGVDYLDKEKVEIESQNTYNSNLEYEYSYLKGTVSAKQRISEYYHLYSKALEEFKFDPDQVKMINNYILKKVLDQKNYPSSLSFSNLQVEEQIKKIIDDCFENYDLYYGTSNFLFPKKIENDEVSSLSFYNTQYYFEFISIHMPKHNGRTLLLKMIESLIDTLNINLKSDFDSSLVVPDATIKNENKNLLASYYGKFFSLLDEIGFLNKFKLKDDICSFIKDTLNLKEYKFNIAEEMNVECLYIPILLEVSKSDYTSIPIQICLNVIHYLKKISILNVHKYNEALQEVITLFNREFYLVNDSKLNDKKYYGSQAKKRDDILSEILHKYLGYNDIKIIALLDILDDFKAYDEKKLEKVVKSIELKGIKLCIIKFDEYKGTQVKFASTKFVQMKHQNGDFPLYFLPKKVEKEKFLSDISSSEINYLDRLGNMKYGSLESVENYFYGKKMIYVQETVPVITKYEINQFYEDLLDINSVVADLNNIITTNQKTKYFGGYSIGVFGNFGSGKSSLINILFSLLQSKNKLNTEIPRYESTYKLTLSDYSSESIVEEIYLQIEKTIIEENTIHKPRPYMLRLQFKYLCKRVNLFKKKCTQIRYEKNRIENEFYIEKLIAFAKNTSLVVDKEIENFLNFFEPYTKKKILKVVKKYIKSKQQNSQISEVYRKLSQTKRFFGKKKSFSILNISSKDIAAMKQEQKKVAKELKKKKVEASIFLPPKALKSVQGLVKKKINQYINCNKEIETAQEIEDHANLIKKRKQYKRWAFFWSIFAIVLWATFIAHCILFNGNDSKNNIFTNNIFNVIPLIAVLPSFIASYYLYQGVRTRHTNFLSQNKIAVFHIEKLLEYSKVLLFKDNKKQYKKLKKIDPNFSSYPLNTIIMIDNLDRISNERIGNVLQGISFINNEIKNSNLTFIIPISYEKFNENTYFLNEGYVVEGKENIRYTYKNPEIDMPFVMSNAYLNKIFDYKVYIPLLSEKKFERLISNILNKAIQRTFMPISKDYFLKLEEFLKKYFYERKTKNLRDVANILNDLFTNLNLIYASNDENDFYFAVLMILILCDVRYQFTEFIEELILESGFINHFLEEAFKVNIKVKKIGFNQNRYSDAFYRKVLYSVEGKRYIDYFKATVNLFGAEVKKEKYENIENLKMIGQVFKERISIDEVQTNQEEDKT